MTHWQDTIANAVKARGYDGQGMTKEQFCFSQLCKAIEELDEVGACFGVGQAPYIILRELKSAAYFAKGYFNRADRMGDVKMNDLCLAEELADVLITLVMVADVLGVDLQQMAIDKARGDVSRGIRKNPDTISP